MYVFSHESILLSPVRANLVLVFSRYEICLFLSATPRRHRRHVARTYLMVRIFRSVVDYGGRATFITRDTET